MATYKWQQLSRAQQDAARRVRQKLWDLGLSATASQIARHFDEGMDWERGDVTLEDFARTVSAERIAPPPQDPDSIRRDLAAWRAGYEKRDELVRAALAARIAKSEIHEATGIARSTIDRIEAASLQGS